MQKDHPPGKTSSRVQVIKRLSRMSLSIALRQILIAVFALSGTFAIGATTKLDLTYIDHSNGDVYAQKMCVLDVYYPDSDHDNTPVLIWFHGGGLEGGSKSSKLTAALAESFASQSIMVVVPDYRLSPEVTYPTYLEDAAAAVRYVQDQLLPAESQRPIFIGGHSAGAYIASMLALDPQYLTDAGVDASAIGGFIPVSGQVMTHFTVAKEKGIERPAIYADAAAPIYHIKKETSPILIIIGGDDWPARLEENRYFVAAMRKVAENENISLVEVPERSHGGILKGMASPDDPAAIASMHFMQTGKLPTDQRIKEN